MTATTQIGLTFEPWITSDFDSLPDDVKLLCGKHFNLIHWDEAGPEYRRARIAQIDYESDPENNDERERLFSLVARLQVIATDLTKWQLSGTPTASDMQVRDANIARLKDEQSRINHELCDPAANPSQAGVGPAPEVPVVEVLHWKMRIQTQAATHMKMLRASNANPTISSILDYMVRWCRENDVKTVSGIFPSAGYLRTHVLGGKHWTPPR